MSKKIYSLEEAVEKFMSDSCTGYVLEWYPYLERVEIRMEKCLLMMM